MASAARCSRQFNGMFVVHTSAVRPKQMRGMGAWQLTSASLGNEKDSPVREASSGENRAAAWLSSDHLRAEEPMASRIPTRTMAGVARAPPAW